MAGVNEEMAQLTASIDRHAALRQGLMHRALLEKQIRRLSQLAADMGTAFTAWPE